MIIKILFSILAILINILGTYYISKSLFFKIFAFPLFYKKAINKNPSISERLSAFIFSINSDDYIHKFIPNKNLSSKKIKKVRDELAPVKGFLLIVLGSIIQIILLF